MSTEKETPEAIEAAEHSEKDMELINRAWNEWMSISLPGSEGNFVDMCEARRRLNPLDVNANVVRSRLAVEAQQVERCAGQQTCRRRTLNRRRYQLGGREND